MEINVVELSDFDGTLGEFYSIINNLIKIHGDKTLVKFDAGYNNVDVVLKTV